jgi:hypothetical protein
MIPSYLIFLDDAVANFKDVVGLVGLIMGFVDVELNISLPTPRFFLTPQKTCLTTNAKLR